MASTTSKALHQPEIIYNICINFSHKEDIYSLKQCLLVNTLWFNEAVRVLWHKLELQDYYLLKQAQKIDSESQSTSLTKRITKYDSAIQEIVFPLVPSYSELPRGFKFPAVRYADVSRCGSVDYTRQLVRLVTGPTLQAVQFSINSVDNAMLDDLVEQCPSVELRCKIFHPNALLPFDGLNRHHHVHNEQAQVEQFVSRYPWKVWDMEIVDLEIEGYPTLPGWVIAKILSNPSVREANISDNWTSIDFKHTWDSQLKLENIKRLTIGYNFTFNMELGISNEDIYTQFPNLESLALDGDNTILNDALMIIPEYAPKIKELVIKDFQEIDFESLSIFAEEVHRLETLRIEAPKLRVLDYELQLVIQSAHYLKDLRILAHTIDAVYRTSLFIYLGNYCPDLHTFDLTALAWGRDVGADDGGDIGWWCEDEPLPNDAAFANLHAVRFKSLSEGPGELIRFKSQSLVRPKTVEYLRPLERISWHGADGRVLATEAIPDPRTKNITRDIFSTIMDEYSPIRRQFPREYRVDTYNQPYW